MRIFGLIMLCVATLNLGACGLKRDLKSPSQIERAEARKAHQEAQKKKEAERAAKKEAERAADIEAQDDTPQEPK